MKKHVLAVCIIFLAGLCVSVADGALEGDFSTYTILSGDSITSAPIPNVVGGMEHEFAVAGTVYSSMEEGSGWYGISATDDIIAYDDYDSINDAAISLDQMQFIGGVANNNEIIWFDFFDSGDNWVDGFGVQFDEGGDYLYSIFGLAMTIPDAGIVQLTADTGSTGTWFLSDASPTIGSQMIWPGWEADGKDLSTRFALNNNVPEPASMMLLGLGGLMLRKRKA